MGGQKKRKNPGVGVDFKRVKHKVGKKLAKAQNDTDTNFKSRTISLPSQTVQQDKDGLAVNFQNLTLKELLNQTSHYSEKARKQALLGLADLFSRHPAELKQHMHHFFVRVAERVADGDSGVRQALRGLMRDNVLPLIDSGALRPFMPVIMARVCGAMTNLNLEVRMDALNFLDVLMDHSPGLVVAGFLSPCLAHFCDLLSAAHRGRNIKAQSTAALLKVVDALNSFLHRAFPQGPTSTSSPAPTSTQPAAAAAAATDAQADVAGAPGSNSHADSVHAPPTLAHSRCAWPSRAPSSSPAPSSSHGPASTWPPPGALPLLLRSPSLPWTSQPTSMGTSTVNHPASSLLASPPSKPQTSSLSRPLHTMLGGKDTPASSPAAGAGAASTTSALAAGPDPTLLARRLVGLLYSCWAECAPAQTNQAPELEPLQVLTGIMSASLLLTRNMLLQGGPSAAAGGPGGRGLARCRPRDWATLVDLQEDVVRRLAPHFPTHVPAVKPSTPVAEALCQYNLQAAQVLAMFLPMGVEANDAAQAHGKPLPNTWVDTLLAYYTGVLDTGLLVPCKGMLSETTSDGSTTATAAAFTSVLQGVSTTLPVVGRERSQVLLAAMGRLMGRMPARSGVTAACLRMEHMLMIAWRTGDVYLDEAVVVGWLAALPKLMWELGTNAPASTQVALHMLHDAARFACPGSPIAEALQALQPQLAPLWCVQLPAKKHKQQKQQAADGASTPQAAAAQLPQGSSEPCPGCTAAYNAAAGEQAAAAAGPAAAVHVAGPLTKLPASTQQLAVDLLYHLGSLQRPLLKSLAVAVQDPAVLPDSSLALRLAEVVTAAMPRMQPPTALSWAVTLLFGGRPSAPGSPASGRSGRPWAVQQAMADLVLRTLPGLLPVSTAVRLIESRITEALQPGVRWASDLQRYSLICLAAAAAAEAQVTGASQVPAGLPGPLDASLAPLMVDWYASQSKQAGGTTAAAATAAWRVCFDLVKIRADLLLPLLDAVSQRACGTEGTAPSPAAASSAGKVQKQKKGCKEAGQQQQHNAECARVSFYGALGLLCQVLNSQTLRPALLPLQAQVKQVAAAAGRHVQHDARLSGDAGCAALCSRVEQLLLHMCGA